MPKFRSLWLTKTPTVVEARRCQEPENPGELAHWCGGTLCGHGACGEKMWIEMPTPEGTMRANYGDWIVEVAEGVFYPCEPDTFEQLYKSVEEGEANDRS